MRTNISALSLKEQDKGVYRKSRNGEWVNAKDISKCICYCFHCTIQTTLQMAVEIKDSIAILWLHLSLNQPSVVYCFFFFSNLFPLINER
ncbi:hypothetical protein ES332_A01G135700v1 [Gossypium tomentosum]|uniref:Uncharacterized protein n=1 Tax=Gossypium tomentosum TaxID=34277 RepID=A0A5D2RRK0_GOSTO|nr:hypothetical protein ES332_A01G135700v1 [Gossypium tomentosum]